MDNKTLEQLQTEKQNHQVTMNNLEKDINKLEQQITNLRNLQREGDILIGMYNHRILILNKLNENK